jgi:hypothetical protein
VDTGRHNKFGCGVYVCTSKSIILHQHLTGGGYVLF